MGFELKGFLDAVGSTAGLIFASWLFLSVLQTRYTAAYDRYRALVDEYRHYDCVRDARQRSVERQVLLYKRRCEHMRAATNVGVVAAMLLVVAIVCGGVQVVFPAVEVIKYGGVIAALLGLLMLLVAAGFVLLENLLLQRAIDGELSDLPQLRAAYAAGASSIAEGPDGHAERPVARR